MEVGGLCGAVTYNYWQDFELPFFIFFLCVDMFLAVTQILMLMSLMSPAVARSCSVDHHSLSLQSASSGDCLAAVERNLLS